MNRVRIFKIKNKIKNTHKEIEFHNSIQDWVFITVYHLPSTINCLNDNHKMHGSWDMEHNRQNFLSFRAIFCTFTFPLPPADNLENQNFEKTKKSTYITIIWYMEHDRHNFLPFWVVFCTFTPLTTQKTIFLK